MEGWGFSGFKGLKVASKDLGFEWCSGFGGFEDLHSGYVGFRG